MSAQPPRSATSTHAVPTSTQRLGDWALDLLLAVVRAVGAIGRPLRRPLGSAWNALTRAIGLRPDALTRPSTVGMQRLALAGLVANCFIVVSGGLVRLTESGLGCPTWPRCTPGSLLPTASTDIPRLQMAIEFGNRMVTFLVLTISVLVLVAAVHVRDRRPDLARVGVVQPVGVLAQGALGGLTVLSGLHPALVGSHYLLSAVVILASVALVARTREGDQAPVRVAGPRSTRVATVLPYVGFVLLAAGTVVTGAGPHAGDEDAQRYGFFGAQTVEVAARIHSGVMWVTFGLVIALLVLVRREPAPSAQGVGRLRRRINLLVLVILAQGVIGYVQYFTGVPAWLVLLHIAGSVTFWVALLVARFAARDRGPAEAWAT